MTGKGVSCGLRFAKTGLCHGFARLREVHPGLVQVLSSFTRGLYSVMKLSRAYTLCGFIKGRDLGEAFLKFSPAVGIPLHEV